MLARSRLRRKEYFNESDISNTIKIRALYFLKKINFENHLWLKQNIITFTLESINKSISDFILSLFMIETCISIKNQHFYTFQHRRKMFMTLFAACQSTRLTVHLPGNLLTEMWSNSYEINVVRFIINYSYSIWIWFSSICRRADAYLKMLS